MVSTTKQFTKNNQGFICINCGKEVEPHPSSSRDHCNYCLYGKHVDINPGDRLNDCKGKLKPIGIKLGQKNQIVYKCLKCNKVVRCVVAPDDNSEEIINLSKQVWQSED